MWDEEHSEQVLRTVLDFTRSKLMSKRGMACYQIDPAVLIDDDGQGYYYWGQGVPKVA